MLTECIQPVVNEDFKIDPSRGGIGVAEVVGRLLRALTSKSILMKVIRYTHPLRTLREWDARFADPFDLIPPLFATSFTGGRHGEIRPNQASGVEWYEDDSHFHARVELPGIKREHLHLDAEEGLLRLRHEWTGNSGDESRISRSEYVLRCPEGVRLDGIEARLADGILQVSLPKQAVRKPVQIEVR
jgi:HSP20 family molecular chaperone IbpA